MQTLRNLLDRTGAPDKSRSRELPSEACFPLVLKLLPASARAHRELRGTSATIVGGLSSGIGHEALM
ncbi:MAG: hypothetical protein HGB01_06685 [Chlorobiaceae bacterium]|nr:hypothetical protein [Chlorobiaceae bacterium]